MTSRSSTRCGSLKSAFSSLPEQEQGHTSIVSSDGILTVPDKCSSVISINTTPGDIPHVKIIAKDLIRDLSIPRSSAPHLTAFVTSERFRDIKSAAKGFTPAEKEALAQRYIQEKDALRAASKARKAKMGELDQIRKENVKLNDLEEEAKKQAEYLCEKANRLREEQEEEIKQMNELILSSKVQAIRDSQISEKKLIKNEWKKVDAGLDAMMEKRRIEGLLQEEEKARKRKEEAHEAAAMLQEQIHENFETRLLEQEKKTQEGEEMKKYFEKLQLEDMHEMEQQKIKQKQLLETLLKENATIAKQKEYKKKQSKQEDILITEFQKQKAQKEEREEAEVKERKRLRELEIAKLREQQEQASDLQAEKDALRARRAQEEKEREYRRKEKERAIKNKAVQDNLKKSRSEQLETQNRLRLIKAEKEQKEFQEMVKKNNFEMSKEELMRQMKRAKNFEHANEIRNQIKEKEREKINERKEFFFEGIHKQQEEKQRNHRLEVLKRKKLEELKNYDIPQTYLSHVQRKIQLPPE